MTVAPLSLSQITATDWEVEAVISFFRYYLRQLINNATREISTIVNANSASYVTISDNVSAYNLKS